RIRSRRRSRQEAGKRASWRSPVARGLCGVVYRNRTLPAPPPEAVPAWTRWDILCSSREPLPAAAGGVQQRPIKVNEMTDEEFERFVQGAIAELSRKQDRLTAE